MTTEEFVKREGIKMSSEQTKENPNMESWTDADHYKCVLRKGKRRVTVYFSKGFGHEGKEPAEEEVLDCCASDAASVENAQSFGEWAQEMGYEMGNIHTAEKAYKACVSQAKKLKRFLGNFRYRELLWEVERA